MLIKCIFRDSSTWSLLFAQCRNNYILLPLRFFVKLKHQKCRFDHFNLRKKIQLAEKFFNFHTVIFVYSSTTSYFSEVRFLWENSSTQEFQKYFWSPLLFTKSPQWRDHIGQLWHVFQIECYFTIATATCIDFTTFSMHFSGKLLAANASEQKLKIMVFLEQKLRLRGPFTSYLL